MAGRIGTTVTLLGPGRVFLNPGRINRGNMPEVFKKWGVIWCPEMIDTGYSPTWDYPRASIGSGTNFFMINPNLAVVNEALDPLAPTVVTVGSFHAGTSFNIIPDTARMSGTTRTFDHDIWNSWPERLEKIIGVADIYKVVGEYQNQRFHKDLFSLDSQSISSTGSYWLDSIPHSLLILNITIIQITFC